MPLKKASATNCTSQIATKEISTTTKKVGVFQPDCPAYSSTGRLNPHDTTEGWQQHASLPTTERGKSTLLCKQMQLHFHCLPALLPRSFLTAMWSSSSSSAASEQYERPPFHTHTHTHKRTYSIGQSQLSHPSNNASLSYLSGKQACMCVHVRGRRF